MLTADAGTAVLVSPTEWSMDSSRSRVRAEAGLKLPLLLEIEAAQASAISPTGSFQVHRIAEEREASIGLALAVAARRQ